jgi:thioredoxin 1
MVHLSLLVLPYNDNRVSLAGNILGVITTMLLHEFEWKKDVVHAGEPVLVDFWATWCPPCRAMNPAIESLAKDFKVCKVNVDTNQELASACGVSSIPALLVINEGKIVARHVGVTPETTLRAELEQFSRK